MPRELGRLDVLLNNAGRGYYARTRDVDLAELEGLFALNVLAPLRLTQLALPALAASSSPVGKSTVVMISSIAGVLAAPTMGAYAASKFALEAVAMALRSEVAGNGIQVLVVRPGPVETPSPPGWTRECARKGPVRRPRSRSPSRSGGRSTPAVRSSKRACLSGSPASAPAPCPGSFAG